MQALWAHPQFYKAIYSKAEDTSNKTRTDITIYKLDQGSKQNFVPLAVIEFKRRTIITGNDFKHCLPKFTSKIKLSVQGAPSRNHDEFFATMSIRNVPSTIDPAAHLAWSAARNELITVVSDPSNKTDLDEHMVRTQAVQSTLFPHGPQRLIQQATSYAIEHRTRYVALCDYDYLVLCYFHWLDTSQSCGNLRVHNHNTSNRYPLEVDIYPLKSTQAFPSESGLMRQALLGFLWHAALDKTGR